MIQTDPDLSPGLMKELKRLVAPYPNFYVIRRQSMDNKPNLRFPTGLGKGTIETGDQSLLLRAIRDAKNKVYIETHLDADDGLPFYMLQHLREQAIQKLGSSSRPTKDKWLVQCIHNNIGWHPAQQGDPDQSGLLKVHEHPDDCPSPGMSKAFGPGTFHRMPTTLSVDEMGRCNTTNATACVSGMGQVPGAVRARTVASAGMNGVGDELDDSDKTELMWSHLLHNYNIKKEDVVRTAEYFVENGNAIARENLKGLW